MKRFIDIRGQNFAWWDTGEYRFEEHNGFMVWGNWEDFEMDYEGNDLERYKRLCPKWVFGKEEKKKEGTDGNITLVNTTCKTINCPGPCEEGICYPVQCLECK